MGSDTIINATCSAASGEATGIYVDAGTFDVGDNLKIIAKGEGDGSIWVRGINSEVHPHRDYIEYVNEYPAPVVNIGENLKVIAINEATAEKHYTYDKLDDQDYIDNIDKPHTNSTSYAMYINYGKVTADKNSVIYSAGSGDGEITVRGIYINSVDNPLRDDPQHVDVEMIPAEVTLKENAILKASNIARNGDATGICARNIVNVESNSQIIVTAEGEHHDTIGVYTESKKYDAALDKDFTTKAEVNLTDTDITVINNSTDTFSYTAGIEATAESKVKMQGGSIAGKSADNQEFKAIVTYDSGEVNVKDAVIAGSLIADDQGVINMEANDSSSYLIGTVTTDNGVRNGGSTTDLTFKNTTWYMTGDSNVTNLNLDGGVVSMVANEKDFSYTDYEVEIEKIADDEIEYYYDVANESYTQKSIGTVSGNAHKLSIDKALNGSGTFIMDLTYHDNDVKSYENATDSDFVYIHGGDNSEQRLVFKDNNSNLGAMASDDKLYFAQIKQDAATFGDGGDNVGEYSTVTAINEKGIYDLEFYIDSEQNAEQTDYNDWFITGKTKKSNPNGDGPIHSYNAGFALWRDDDTLLKRLGELRFTNDEGGAWARVIGKKLEDNRSLGFNTHAKTVQVGYDRKDVQEDGSGTWRKGVALGHTWADTGFRGGRGENNYTDLTLYATNIRKHDHYWDLVARIGYIDSEYDTAYGDRGEFDNWAGSLSAEYGRKKKLNEDNWFIEPQAQLTYSYMWGDSYTTRNGARVVQSDADSLVGRAGFIISKEIESERKYPHRYYAKAFIMHEFLDGGDNNIYFDSDRLYGGSDFKDTWYVAGVGANVDMGNSCTFYFDAERNFKAHAKMPYRIEAGFRWEF
ncbi:MAG: autotransporter outer membrane beta-barrel domain-containing protein [Phascolarctobacterium sp.]|nr:autotransporter outer membrane beta-barrel domain-containing protein [Phascolarctobacterium sp.]